MGLILMHFERYDEAEALTREAAAQDRVAADELPTDAFTLVDLDLAWRSQVADRAMTLFIRGGNLLDEDARRHASPLKDFAPLPGRSLGLGVRFDF